MAEISFIISPATLSVHLDQASTTLLYFSPLVIRPSEYWFSYSPINFLVSLINWPLLAGIIKSSLPNDIPALNACLNPKSLSLSQYITVFFWPQNLNIESIISETIFFGKSLSTKENLISLFLGNKLASKNLPAVLVYFSTFVFPSSSIVSNLEITVECTFISPDSNPCSFSLQSVKYPSIFSVWKGGWDK